MSRKSTIRSTENPFSKLAFLFLCGLIFTIPLENVVSLEGIGTITRLIGFAAVGAIIYATLGSGHLRKLLPFHIACAIFVFWVILSYFWTINPGETATKINTYAQNFAMSWLIWELGKSHAKLNNFMLAYLIGCLVASINIIYNFSSSSMVATSSRYSAANMNLNDIAILISIAIPMAWYLSITETRRLWRIISQVYIPLSIIGVVLTVSRGGFLAMATALLATVLWLPKGGGAKQQIILVIFILIAYYIVQTVVPTYSLDRLATIDDEIFGGGDFTNRKIYWIYGIDSFKAHPVMGGGAGGYRDLILLHGGPYAIAHNTFMSVLVELGIIGLGLFVMLIWIPLSSIRYMVTLERRLWVILLITWATGAVSLTWEYRKGTWFILAMFAAYAGTAKQLYLQSKAERDTQADQYAVDCKSNTEVGKKNVERI